MENAAIKTRVDPGIIERLVDTYASLHAHNLDKLEDVYAHDIHFEDPFRTIHSLTAFKQYVNQMYQRLTRPRFEFKTPVIQDNHAFVEWTFHFSHPVLSLGREVAVPGVSKLEFSEKIHTQKDYFDSGVVFFEQLPFLGKPIHFVKNRLQPQPA